MSNLILSYLIEPVVRRARRYSGHSTTNDNPHPSNPPSSNNGAAASEHNDPLSDIMEEGLETWDRSLIIEDVVLETVSGQPLVQSPTREYERLELEVNAASAISPAPNGQASGSTSRHNTYQLDDDTSDNPLHGIPERFRSTTTSISSSMHIPLDANSASGEGFSHSRADGEHEAPRSAAGSYSSSFGKGALPADDGMSVLRKRIIEVGQMDATNEEKARLTHILMTEQYSSSQTSLQVPRFARPNSPSSLASQDRPVTPTSSTSQYGCAQSPSTPTSISGVENSGNLCTLTPEDLEPTYVPKPAHSILPTSADGSRRESMDQDSETEADEKLLGCEHYKRNVKLQCSTCCRWYTCRFCHDQVEDHSLNRRDTKNMLCMLCGHAQPAGEVCVNCGEPGARYYCAVCKLWDDDNAKSIYHCYDCGICRVGQGLGKDFFHCKTCSVCMSISIRDTHRCIERSTDCDCPICGEYMFTSPQTVVFMRCGHSIHHLCYYEHMKQAYRCPICSRSVQNMEMQFKNLERLIESQPMPPQFQDTKALIYCNDCSAKTSVKYHWLGSKCAVCDSFNTAQIQILAGPDAQAPVTTTSSTEQAAVEDGAHLSPTTPRPISRGRVMRGPGSSRRPTSAASVTEPRRFSPYPIQHRAGRSASPLASRSLDTPLAPSLHIDETSDHADDDEVGFWRGESRGAVPLPDITQGEDAAGRNEVNGGHDHNKDDIDGLMEEDDRPADDDDEGDDDDNDNDHMEIFGHR